MCANRGAAVLLPIVLSALGLVVSIITIFIARADVTTVPVAIFRLLSRPGAQSIGTASALSLVLLVLVGAVVVIGERLRGGEHATGSQI